MDDQVKIRGFRIELGEIEATLASHGDVASTVVMAREDEHKQLVAYVVSKDASALTSESSLLTSSGDTFQTLKGESLPALTESLRNHLARSLPDYMIPAFFVYLDQLPLTSNGKIDRKALPAPDPSLRQIGDVFVAPETDTELALTSIWSEVLKLETIGVHDNFFRIGGDSIISIQLVSRARKQGLYFQVKDVFKHPTIKELASQTTLEAKLTTITQELVSGDVPLIPIQRAFFEATCPFLITITRLFFFILKRLYPSRFSLKP